MKIRSERPGDERAISKLVGEAFAKAEHSDGTEPAIVERLRRARALTISLVATDGDEIVGHVAISPVTIDGLAGGWQGLGPVAVRPDRQRRGIGAALITRSLDHLRDMGANGCVVLGEPAFYGRFGFTAAHGLRFPGPPPEYFQLLTFTGDMPNGTVAYHPTFG